MNKFDAVFESFKEAQKTLKAVDNLSNMLAEMLVGRLRKCSWQHLDK